MKQSITQNHWTARVPEPVQVDGGPIKYYDAPAGGCTFGPGLCISWQNGPLGRGDERKEPNGAFVETVIAAAIGRLDFYQSSRFNCAENQAALSHLHAALGALEARTLAREQRQVEGTHAK